MGLRLTDDFCDLVLHVMAHVRMAGPGCLFDARYVDGAASSMPPRERRWLDEGVAVFERAWGVHMPDAVHGWPQLLGSIGSLRAVARLELAELRPEHVRDAGMLAVVQRRGGPDLELLHATLCLLGPWFERWREEVVAPRLHEAMRQVEPWYEEAARLWPALDESPVELAWALGEHGRAFRGRIVVGAPAPWNGLDARSPAVLALHERLVTDSDEPGYAGMEWEALTGLAALMRRAETPLAPVHARWVASLDLRSVLDGLPHERLTPAERQALVREGEGRARRLAELAARP